MAEPITQAPVRGLKHFQRLSPLRERLSPLRERLRDVGCARDRAGNRTPSFDGY